MLFPAAHRAQNDREPSPALPSNTSRIVVYDETLLSPTFPALLFLALVSHARSRAAVAVAVSVAVAVAYRLHLLRK